MPKTEEYFKTKNYSALVDQLQELLSAEASTNVPDLNALRLKNYWRIGHKLVQTQKKHPHLKFSSHSVDLQRLAQDLKTSSSNLYKMLLFKRHWPEAVPQDQNNRYLPWALHYELLNVKDEKARRFYHDEALKQDWSRDTLRHAIRLKLFEQDRKKYRQGTIPAQQVPFYTYVAQPLRVLDGDTLEVKIDLGFKTYCEQMLRLRGVNAPELHSDPTQRAAQAKARLEEILVPLKHVVIKTYKTDVYGRYLVDLYYHPSLKSQEEILAQGFFLNQQILNEGLADWMVM